MNRGTRRGVAVGAAAIALAGPARAHLVQTGFGGFYDGIVHLVITPADVLAVLAIASYAGLRGVQSARLVLAALPGAWLLSGAGGTLVEGAPESALAWATAASLVACGVLLAANPRLPERAVALVAALVGSLHGYAGGATMTTGGSDLLGSVGAAVTVFVLVTLVSAGVVRLRAGWPHVAVRVAGSWIGAIGVLTLGWLASGR